jgi:hypothetical protein
MCKVLLMKNEIILFTDGNINIGVQIKPEQETVWLTQKYCLMLSICSSRSLIRNLKISQTVRLRKVTKMR